MPGEKQPGIHCSRMHVIPIKPGNLCMSSDVNWIIFLRFTEYCAHERTVYTRLYFQVALERG